MLESRTVSTEYGDIMVPVYVCDWCFITTPQADPGAQWISVLTLNANVDASVRLNNHFCKADHAMSWKQAIDAYIASLGATPNYGLAPKVRTYPPPQIVDTVTGQTIPVDEYIDDPPPITPDITPDATPSDPLIDPV